MGFLHWLEIDRRFDFRSFLGLTYRYSPQEGTAFERVVQTLTLMQAIKAEPALDHLVREIDLPAIGSGDNAVTLVVAWSVNRVAVFISTIWPRSFWVPMRL
jgi:hypothetical protein